jgi:branched-chain amino acid transport system substrate-binding protein
MATTDRLPVLKTYKLYIGGQFPRTESGRSYLVRSGDGDALANAREAQNHTYLAKPSSGDNPAHLEQTIVASYRKRFNKETDAIAALAYDAVKVLADAMNRAKSTDGPKVRDALAKADVAGVTGQLKMNADRNVDKPAVVQEVTYANGQVKFVYKTTVSPG